jgi:hypothetical protein
MLTAGKKLLESNLKSKEVFDYMDEYARVSGEKTKVEGFGRET